MKLVSTTLSGERLRRCGPGALGGSGVGGDTADAMANTTRNGSSELEYIISLRGSVKVGAVVERMFRQRMVNARDGAGQLIPVPFESPIISPAASTPASIHRRARSFHARLSNRVPPGAEKTFSR
jgi:hypothetical protein